jgi:hypothetical protein
VLRQPVHLHERCWEKTQGALPKPFYLRAHEQRLYAQEALPVMPISLVQMPKEISSGRGAGLGSASRDRVGAERDSLRRVPRAISGVPPENPFGEHSEPRCGNVPLTRTPNTTREDALPQTPRCH